MIAPKTEFKTIGFKQRRKTALICFFAVLLAFVFSAISCGVLPREELSSGLTASTGVNSEPYVSEETENLSKTVTTDKKTVTETADKKTETGETINLGEIFSASRMTDYFKECSCLTDFLYYLSEIDYSKYSRQLSYASYFGCEEYSAIRLKFTFFWPEYILVENYNERTFSIYEIFDSGVVRDTDFYNTENIGVKMKKPLKDNANYSSSKRSFSHLSKGESVDFSAISSGGAIDGYLSVKSAYSAKVLKEKTLYSGIACFDSSADTVPYYRMPDNSDIIRIFDIITAEKPALMTLKDYDYTDGAVKLY
ncbi:MAG: hypothetical protein VB118_06180, partial [Oscillospiraceae bacterium]|nr:hypothetical protein [Oscillospiraceae bacterium]